MLVSPPLPQLHPRMALRFPPCTPLLLPFHFPTTIRSIPSSLFPGPPLPFSTSAALKSLPSRASASTDATASVTASTACTAPPTPVFLPHLELDAAEEDAQEGEGGVVESEEGETAEDEEELGQGEDDGEEDPDPIRSFFESKLQVPDPSHEGRTSLQKNRRTSWRLADAAGMGAEEDELVEIELGLGSGCQTPSLTAEDEGIVGEILTTARGIPENSTLGESMGSFAGKVGEGDCIQLLVRMGEEGLISDCLHLFEWMGLQEPSLVTPRSCSVLFPMLGRAGKGKKLMTLFENLPRAKRFRDVHVYNAAISGLACCGR